MEDLRKKLEEFNETEGNIDKLYYDDYVLKFTKKILNEHLNTPYEKLKANVLNWAKEKGILDKATPMSQSLKTLEEVNELLIAINNNDTDEIKDAFGDILVTIIIGAELCKMDITDCLDSAYNVIKNRTGKMIDGQFVKDK